MVAPLQAVAHSLCTGSEFSTNRFFAYASRTVQFAQLSLTRKFRVGDMEVVGSFDLHQHHLFLIDIVEFFTKGMTGSSAK